MKSIDINLLKNSEAIKEGFDYHDLLRLGTAEELDPKKLSALLKAIVLTLNEIIPQHQELWSRPIPKRKWVRKFPKEWSKFLKKPVDESGPKLKPYQKNVKETANFRLR